MNFQKPFIEVISIETRLVHFKKIKRKKGRANKITRNFTKQGKYSDEAR